ncbi:hemicentin-1-like isoform X2 [Gigantopelta aegis]|uniref:hemicentin-1-like isoform X2 n=1 Tax=Gigantopelta aegis TaxID=1735272 RepID=UPI001B88B94E|nr:hemicentin-1-like isoform X2 [Gigantopelta aegis]
MRHTIYLWIYILILTSCVSSESNTAVDCMDGGYPGQSTKLTCTITGTIVSGIIWLRPNGGSPQEVVVCNTANTICEPSGGITGYSAVIDSRSQITLTVESFNTAVDAGEWICRDGPVGVPSTCTKTLLNGPDSVTFNPPPPRYVTEGHSLTVMCAASCNPPCSYSWTLENRLISSTSQLTLTNINRSQTGNVYTCNVTNSLIPKSKTKQFTLTVYYGPDSVQLNSSSPLTIQEDNNVAVSCEATDCSPSCSFTWKFNSRIKSTRSVLSLINIQISSAGDYTCTAVNTNAMKAADKIITLDVQYQSSITSLTMNSLSTKVTVDELTPMTLRCDVTSNPRSDIKLLNNSQTLHEVTNSKQVEYTWNEAGCLDTGHYTCEAGNKIQSSVRESLQLVVRCSPRLDHRVPFKDRFVTAVGGDVTLTISVIANPTPTFTWYRPSDGKKMILTFGSSSTTDVSAAVGNLTLTNVQQGDFGIYVVVVSNGSPQPDLVVNITLVEEGPPSIPSNVIVWSDVPSTFSVAWTEEFNGGLPQTFLIQYQADEMLEWKNTTKIFKETGLKKNHGASISNLQPRTRYLVRVLAYNREGYKGFTPEQEVLTDANTTEKDNLLGTGIGIGIGITVAICLCIGGIVFTYWWMRKAKAKPEHTYAKRQPNTGVQETALYEDLEQTRGDGSSTQANVSSNYSSLEARRDAPYDVLRVYDNTSEVKE